MRQVPILMYHWFRAENESSNSRSPALEVTPAQFDRHMSLLGRAGYRTISLKRAMNLDGEGPPPRHAVVLTFDDGTLDFANHARPVLERHGFTATQFVVTGHVGGTNEWDRRLGEPERSLMDWDQIAELYRAGYEIASHTHTHRRLTELTDDDARTELERSHRILEQRLGTAPRFVAYPHGFYSARHKRLAREAGYAGACAVILHWGDLWRSDPYELKRMTVKGTESLMRFRLRLARGGITGEGNHHGASRLQHAPAFGSWCSFRT